MLKKICAFLSVFLFLSVHLFAQSIAEKTKGSTEKKGFYTLFANEESGKVYLLVDRLNEDFLYVNFLVTGIGSNDIGLDRGQVGNTRIVHFKKIGNKIFLIQPNQNFRAVSDNLAEKKSVEEAFAQSVLAAFPIEAQKENDYLIDITSFIVQDVHGVAETLKQSGEGSYSFDASRSAVWFDVLKSFPDNNEMEALITLKGSNAGQQLRTVTPTSDAVSFRVRHSFVRLPDADFEPVPNHPRSGFFGISYQDYASPIQESITKSFIEKHRLKKKNPSAALSEAVEPIVYYVDNGAPEPVRSALIEGASWWNQAFEAAGYKNAFQVKVLPADADPLDCRYNVIQWVHRSTRGWSYGATISDPRTGEIIKGHVSLGSLRVRQDFLIFTGLLSPFKNETEQENEPMTKAALARLRQLAAHEVGHTIGIAHNFAASVNDNASVMDYPHPFITVNPKDNSFNFDKVYATGMGDWDKQVIKFGYADEGDKAKTATYRTSVLAESQQKGLQYIGDYDARIAGGAHPDAHLWDGGKNAAEELMRVTKIRKLALDNFSINAIRNGTATTELQNVLVPMYYFNRFQIEAAVKSIGGVRYSYSVKGDLDAGIHRVSAKQQNLALSALLETIQAENLVLKPEILSLLTPRTPDNYDRREIFSGRTLPTFDPLAAAESQVDYTLKFLFNPARLERIVQQAALESDLPDFNVLIAKPFNEAISHVSGTSFVGQINRMKALKWVSYVVLAASNKRQSNEVRALAHQLLLDTKLDLSDKLSSKKIKNLDKETKTSWNWILRTIESYIENPKEVDLSPSNEMPPGSPIGTYCEWN